MFQAASMDIEVRDICLLLTANSFLTTAILCSETVDDKPLGPEISEHLESFEPLLHPRLARFQRIIGLRCPMMIDDPGVEM